MTYHINGAELGPRPFLDQMRRENESRRYEHLSLRPLGVTIGAEVSGVDLSNVDDATFAEIEQAHLDYKVLFFRDQDLTTDAHLDFAQRFGELEEHPFLPAGDESNEIVRFEKGEEVVGAENVWHSDVSWRTTPALGSVLRAREVPAVGGDTMFSDMIAAYEGLDEDVKEQIDGLEAVHDFSQSFGAMLPKEELAKRQAQFPAVRHPVVRTHPVTGRKILYVNAIFTSHIDGLDRDESDRLLEFLYRQATIPEYQCRFHWEKNSVAFWDNRAVQHYALNDYWPQRRVMERATIIGDRPI